ncbi:MAG: hypothetical protein BYD32DRAFT_428983, partial [Podila humilis]
MVSASVESSVMMVTLRTRLSSESSPESDMGPPWAYRDTSWPTSCISFWIVVAWFWWISPLTYRQRKQRVVAGGPRRVWGQRFPYFHFAVVVVVVFSSFIAFLVRHGLVKCKSLAKMQDGALTFNSCPVAKSAEKEATCPGMVVSSSKTGSGGAVVYKRVMTNGSASVHPVCFCSI